MAVGGADGEELVSILRRRAEDQQPRMPRLEWRMWWRFGPGMPISAPAISHAAFCVGLNDGRNAFNMGYAPRCIMRTLACQALF